MIKPRNPMGHKGTFGHGLLIAGSFGMAGAAVLSAAAALRSGVGKLTVVTPECNRIIIQTALPEAVVQTTLPDDLGLYDAVAIGPGIGQSDEARELVGAVLRSNAERLVIDADGLNCLPASWQQDIPYNAVITPHLGEWKRLTANDTDIATLALAKDTATAFEIYIVLKAARHVEKANAEATKDKIANATVFTPEAGEFLNTTGNSGMATAGSGDVLTGILLALLAQGYAHQDACRLALWLHGKAGDIAAIQLGEYSVIASDIVRNISQAFKIIL